MAALQKKLKQAGRERTASAKEKTMAERKHRFNAARLAAHRTKLGLSVSDYGRLVGMSGGTIYLWEQGDRRPRPEQVQQLDLFKRCAKSDVTWPSWPVRTFLIHASR